MFATFLWLDTVNLFMHTTDYIYTKTYAYATTRSQQMAVMAWNRYKSKGKGHPITGHKDPEGEQMYISTLSLTSALDGVGGQRHAPSVFFFFFFL